MPLLDDSFLPSEPPRRLLLQLMVPRPLGLGVLHDYYSVAVVRDGSERFQTGDRASAVSRAPWGFRPKRGMRRNGSRSDSNASFGPHANPQQP